MTILSQNEKLRLVAALEVKIAKAAECVNKAMECLISRPSNAETARVAECQRQLSALQSARVKLEQATEVDSYTIEHELPVKITRCGGKFYIGGAPSGAEYKTVESA